MAYLLNNLGELHQAAEQYYTHSRRILESALGPRHMLVAESLANHGELKHLEGDLRGAEAVLRQSWAIVEEEAPRHPMAVTVSLRLAQVFLGAGRHESAATFFERSSGLASDLLAEDPDNRQVKVWLASARARAKDACINAWEIPSGRGETGRRRPT